MQRQVHPHFVHLGVREDEVSVSQVQKHQGETGDNPLSGENVEEKLKNIMECPHCHQEIVGKPCPACGAHVPEESRYCMECGAPFGEERHEHKDEEDSFDLEDRVLCPDGTCTGIIVDGKCSECGKPYKESQSES
jgi:DNA-directed RNA polymerase subunit RPC12/RpoP